MMRINAANAAKIVLSNLGVPLVQRQFIQAAGNTQAIKRYAGHNRALSAADGAIAAPDIFMAVDQTNFKLNSFAVAGAFYGLHGAL